MSSSDSTPSWSNCMISAAVKSLVMLPMWNASPVSTEVVPRTASPFAARATACSPSDAPTTVPGTVKAMELDSNELRQVCTGPAIAVAKPLSADSASRVVPPDAGAFEVVVEVSESVPHALTPANRAATIAAPATARTRGVTSSDEPQVRGGAAGRRRCGRGGGCRGRRSRDERRDEGHELGSEHRRERVVNRPGSDGGSNEPRAIQSASTASTPPAKSPSDTTADSTTSASAEHTPEPTSCCSSTTSTSASSTPPPENSSEPSPSTPPRTTNPPACHAPRNSETPEPEGSRVSDVARHHVRVGGGT